jgi:hypothetical protein
MKTLIAFTLVAIRIPNFVGTLLAEICSAPISIIVRLSRRDKETPQEAAAAATQEPVSWIHRGRIEMAAGDRIAHACHDIFAGLGSVFRQRRLHLPIGRTKSASKIVVNWRRILSGSFF